MPKIAILGAGGFLGAPIAKHFTQMGWEVVSFSRRKSPKFIYEVVYADLFKVETLRDAITIARPDVVLSTAWDTEHGKFWTNESNIAYRDATLSFAKLCFELDVQTFIGLGTMSEYGRSPGLCDSETSALLPVDLYSKSKIETGLGLWELGEEYGKKTHWVRIFQAFGQNEKMERFVPSLISKLSKGEKFSILTPNYKMDWIHSEDAASAIYFAVENKLNHFVDIGTGVGTSVKEFSEIICAEIGLDQSLLDFSQEIPGHEKVVVADLRTQLLSLGWSPTGELRDRIRSLR